VSDARGWRGKLAPFAVELHPPGGAPLSLLGRIDAGVYRLIAERRGQRYEIALSEQIEHHAGQPRAQVEAVLRPLGPGLWASVEPVEPGTAAAARGVTLLLRIETRSEALDRGGPVFDRLGGGPALARLLSPPRWTATLRFDSDGEALRQPTTLS
jgi:hypothetical protein